MAQRKENREGIPRPPGWVSRAGGYAKDAWYGAADWRQRASKASARDIPNDTQRKVKRVNLPAEARWLALFPLNRMETPALVKVVLYITDLLKERGVALVGVNDDGLPIFGKVSNQ